MLEGMMILTEFRRIQEENIVGADTRLTAASWTRHLPPSPYLPLPVDLSKHYTPPQPLRSYGTPGTHLDAPGDRPIYGIGAQRSPRGKPIPTRDQFPAAAGRTIGGTELLWVHAIRAAVCAGRHKGPVRRVPSPLSGPASINPTLRPGTAPTQAGPAPPSSPPLPLSCSTRAHTPRGSHEEAAEVSSWDWPD